MWSVVNLLDHKENHFTWCDALIETAAVPNGNYSQNMNFSLSVHISNKKNLHHELEANSLSHESSAGGARDDG